MERGGFGYRGRGGVEAVDQKGHRGVDGGVPYPY